LKYRKTKIIKFTKGLCTTSIAGSLGCPKKFFGYLVDIGKILKVLQLERLK
jgi:hypothetical protein